MHIFLSIVFFFKKKLYLFYTYVVKNAFKCQVEKPKVLFACGFISMHSYRWSHQRHQKNKNPGKEQGCKVTFRFSGWSFYSFFSSLVFVLEPQTSTFILLDVFITLGWWDQNGLPQFFQMQPLLFCLIPQITSRDNSFQGKDEGKK